MIPLGTINNPTRRTPYLTYGLILANILVFLWELTQAQPVLERSFWSLAIIPCQMVSGFVPEHLIDIFRSMFLHAGAWHLIGNMTFLWLFGTNVEDYLGHRSFLFLYLAGGIVAVFAQTLVTPGLCVPMVGASGAVSAILGAYIVLYPGTRVRAGIIFFRYFMYPVKVSAFVMLGLWFALQLFNGMVDYSQGAASGVAFFAHVGGFIFGAAVAFAYMMFRGAPERYQGLD